MTNSNNYNKIAFVYDRLSKLVFGNHIKQSQTCLLSFINPGNKILIVGGGTGWILEEITKLHTSGLHIVYIEASANMLKLSKARNIAENKVAYLNMYIEQYKTIETFDIILTPFLFDNFTIEKATENFNSLNTLLSKNGKWLFADFIINNESPLRHKFLLKIMYLFFKTSSNIQANQLVNMEPFFIENGYNEIFSAFHYNHFIKSVCWLKT